jgi:hypothetical protein
MASHAPPVTPDVGIDMGRNSRQYYVYGESAMKRMARSNILIAGINGVGIEIGTGFPCPLTVPVFSLVPILFQPRTWRWPV